MTGPPLSVENFTFPLTPYAQALPSPWPFLQEQMMQKHPSMHPVNTGPALRQRLHSSGYLQEIN